MQPVALDIDAIRPGSEMNFDTLPGNAIGMPFFQFTSMFTVFFVKKKKLLFKKSLFLRMGMQKLQKEKKSS